jgi:hypothetical protein
MISKTNPLNHVDKKHKSPLHFGKSTCKFKLSLALPITSELRLRSISFPSASLNLPSNDTTHLYAQHSVVYKTVKLTSQSPEWNNTGRRENVAFVDTVRDWPWSGCSRFRGVDVERVVDVGVESDVIGYGVGAKREAGEDKEQEIVHFKVGKEVFGFEVREC